MNCPFRVGSYYCYSKIVAQGPRFLDKVLVRHVVKKYRINPVLFTAKLSPKPQANFIIASKTITKAIRHQMNMSAPLATMRSTTF